MIESIKLEKTRKGNLTCKIKTDGKYKYVYSKYNIESSLKQIRKISSQKIILFGIGLGYEAKYLSNFADEIVVFEKNNLFLDKIENEETLKDVLKKNNIKIVVGEEFKKIKFKSLKGYKIVKNNIIYEGEIDFFSKIEQKLLNQNKIDEESIAVFEHITIADDCIEAFKNIGFKVYKFGWANKEKMLSRVLETNCRYLFTINFSEKVAWIAEKSNKIYISYNVDTPVYSLYSELAEDEKFYKFAYDLEVVNSLRRRGVKNIYYLPVAANVDRLEKTIKETDYKYDVSFVGTIGMDNEYNKNFSNEFKNIYNKKLKQLASVYNDYNELEIFINDRTIKDIEMIGDYYLSTEENLKKKEKAFYLIGRKVNEIQRERTIKELIKRFEVSIFGDSNWRKVIANNYKGCAEHFNEMPNIFRKTKINVNIIRQYVQSGLPMRVFDVMGSRGFLVTNFRDGIDRYFKDGKHCVVYRDLDDLIEITKYYLNHEKERQEICWSGFEEVKRNHSYEKRLKEIIEIVKNGGRTR